MSQCSCIRLDGKQCTRKTKTPSFCWQHQKCKTPMIDIMFACHCKTPFTHYNSKIKQLVTSSKTLRVVRYRPKKLKLQLLPKNYGILGFSSVDYVEINPSCQKQSGQYSDWRDIPDSSKDYIWSVYCHFGKCLYSEGYDKIGVIESKMWNDFLNEGWRILKPRGSLVMPIHTIKPFYEINLRKILEKISKHKWTYKLIKSKDIGFSLESQTQNGFYSQEYLIILTK